MKYHQGKYIPKNPSKYVGNLDDIVWRSSWERAVMNWLDTHPSVIKWSSETTIVPYISPVDNRVHRYFLDFSAMIKGRDGKIQNYIIEVKPKKQTQPPKKQTRVTKRYLEEIKTYAINTSKWQAAQAFADKHNFKFQILTENEIGGII